MAGAGAELAKKLLIFVAGNLLVWGTVKIAENKINGKTWNGKKKETKEKTYVDWQGNIVLGSNDGWVV